MKGTTFSITLPEPIVKQLDEYAKSKLGTSRSGASRFIIIDFFNRQDQQDASISSTIQGENTGRSDSK